MRLHAFSKSAIAVLAMTICWQVTAEERAPEPGELLLNDFVENVHTFSGRFEQQLVDANNIVVEEANGRLEIQKPGRFRWAYVEPYEQILVADGLNVWSYDVDLEQVTVKPQAGLLDNTPASLLGGSGSVLEEFDYIGSFSDRETVWVRLRPKSTDNGFTKVELGFNDGVLRRLTFSDNLEQTTLIALFDVEVNAEIASEQFEFSPPDDADLVGIPLAVTPADQ